MQSDEYKTGDMDLHDLERALGLASTSSILTPSRKQQQKSSASSVSSVASSHRHIQAVEVDAASSRTQPSRVVLIDIPASTSVSPHADKPVAASVHAPLKHMYVEEPVPKWVPVASAGIPTKRPAGGTPSSKP